MFMLSAWLCVQEYTLYILATSPVLRKVAKQQLAWCIYICTYDSQEEAKSNYQRQTACQWQHIVQGSKSAMALECLSEGL